MPNQIILAKKNSDIIHYIKEVVDFISKIEVNK